LSDTLPTASDPISLIRRQLDQTLLRDRHLLRSKLRRVEQLRADGKPFDRLLQSASEQFEHSRRRLEERRTRRLTIEYPPELPISQKRAEIADAIRQNQVVVICGETGSGKTTQLPKICLELGLGRVGMIGHTQPRRIAARSVAQRIAQEMQTGLGDVVGYKVRFTDQVSEASLVKLMTDGILLAEIQNDRFLNAYDAIIIDEAHERSLNIDFLLGVLKRLLAHRPELKLIITSATIDPQRFSRHFNDAPVILVSGRTYPVEVRYRPLKSEDEDEREIELDDALTMAVDEIGRDTHGGDTLIFFPGEREIREAAEVLAGHLRDRCEIVPLFARLSAEEQMRVFAPHDRRRIVLATNVAETSLTVPGIRAVIDTGVARLSRYNPRSKVQRLPIEPISQASADQRKGRCGRIAEGVCVRLYSEEDFRSRPAFTDPEIQRTNLASVILQMKYLRLGAIEDFPFLDPPDPRQIRDGYATLTEIGALDDRYELTEIGRLLAQLPVDPRLGRMILASRELGALTEVLVIAAALAVQDPRERPLDKQKDADAAHALFRAPDSDFMTSLNLWKWWQDELAGSSHSKLRRSCKARFLSYFRMREWHDVHRQLREVAGQMNWPINLEPASYEAIHRSLIPGLLANVGNKGEAFEYDGIRSRKFHLFPGSTTFHKKPAWVVAAEIVETTKVYARTVAMVQPEWIEQAAKHLVRREYLDPHWQRRTARVIAHEKVTLTGLNLIPRRPVNFGPIDPVSARQIFIKSALVDGDYDTNAAFFRHNQQLVRDVQLIEAKHRRADILADPATRFAFYDVRIPADVNSGQTFDRWRRGAEQADRRLLFMSVEDLMSRAAGELNTTQFPDTLDADGVTYPLEYHFEPGTPHDGVTLTVRLAQLNQLPGERLEWLVPGLLEEKVIDLIRTLPKPIRVNLVPVPDFARRAVQQMRFGAGSLLATLAKTLGHLGSVPVTPADFRPDQLEPYLHMNVRVLDEHGKLVAQSRDLDALRRQLRERARQTFASLPPSPFHRDDVKEWDFGDLPPKVELRHGGQTLLGYPAVVDMGDSVALRLLDTWESALVETRRGVRRLFVIEYASALRYEVDSIRGLSQMGLNYATLGGMKQLKQQLADAIVDRLGLGDAPDIRTRMDFELRLESAWNKLPRAAADVGELTGRILSLYQALRRRLDEPFPPLLEANVQDMRDHLRSLIPPDFLTATSYEWLPHLPRFLQALELRHRKLHNAGLPRDTKWMAVIQPFWDEFRQMHRELATSAVDPRDLEQFRWLIEEMRVSLFAQELRTSVPMSVQRLAQKRDQLRAELDK
jgi:ATP-dependent helicase HrpA